MCEWNYTQGNGDDDDGSDGAVVRFIAVRRFVWRLTPWRHDRSCPVRRFMSIGQIVGASD